MTTARQIITTALRKIAATSANSVPTAEDIDIGLETLNALIDSKSTTLLNTHIVTPKRFLFTPGQLNYTLGPTGDWKTERPMRLETAKLIMNPVIISEPVPPPAATYTFWAQMAARNGYDGDVGIAGYISDSNPFYAPFSMGFGTNQTPPDISKTLLTTGTHPSGSQLGIGGGKLSDTAGEVGPMDIGLREYVLEDENTNFTRDYYFPMQEFDQMWCVGTYFAGSSQVFTVDIVIGPSPTEGEWYNCYGNATFDYDGVIIIERLAWAGDR